eukprot:2566273-Alexandrium_andersonii.AAC.1
MEVVQYRCSIQGAVGAPTRKLCAIPQGCPLSMLMIALLATPWLRGLESIPGVVGRALADDLL